MSTETLTERESVRESVLTLALESLQSLEALEDDYSDWLDALLGSDRLRAGGRLAGGAGDCAAVSGGTR